MPETSKMLLLNICLDICMKIFQINKFAQSDLIKSSSSTTAVAHFEPKPAAETYIQ